LFGTRERLKPEIKVPIFSVETKSRAECDEASKIGTFGLVKGLHGFEIPLLDSGKFKVGCPLEGFKQRPKDIDSGLPRLARSSHRKAPKANSKARKERAMAAREAGGCGLSISNPDLDERCIQGKPE
jgi:hypothetical protein